MAKRTFQVPGEARVSFTTLPPDVDAAAAFPIRLLVTRSETRAVWLAKPGRYALLVVDERTAQNRRGLLLVLAFELDAVSLSVFADVSKRLIAATIQEAAANLASEPEEWRRERRRPLPPCPVPRPGPEPVYEILPVPPFVPVPEPKASKRRHKRSPERAGQQSGAEIY